MKLFVYHTPERTPEHEVPDCAIAVDALRATTTMATALASGAEAIEVFADLDALQAAAAKYPATQILKAAERGGSKVEGFDLGNSPFDYTVETVAGKRILMSTTNGTRALQRIQAAPLVLAAAAINLAAVVHLLIREQPEIVWIVGAGWQGSYALEDTVCAGAIAQELKSHSEWGNDETVGALALYEQWQDHLEGLFCLSSHGQRLLRLNCREDIAYCARRSIVDAVPRQVSPGVLAL
ncbi:MAG: 2-phosphosulfolactate phosphatase family protein [Pseudanabaenaceae cyanobacterium]